ncbi:hypothetical protein Hdeb2414_s0017g00508021 [Helianthus debilis subsp. tardiflorus]
MFQTRDLECPRSGLKRVSVATKVALMGIELESPLENPSHSTTRPLVVTNTLVKKVDGACTSYMIPEGLMESFKANVEIEKNQLLEMRKEIEEDHERKKVELEAMQKDIDSQRQNLEAMMQKVKKRLPVGDREE